MCKLYFLLRVSNNFVLVMILRVVIHYINILSDDNVSFELCEYLYILKEDV